jgi:hypothetical protein
LVLQVNQLDVTLLRGLVEMKIMKKRGRIDGTEGRSGVSYI